MIGKLALLIVFVIGVRGVQILDFKVPSRALLGETVTLDCSWQLKDEEPLYRVTLSHDGQEFYRYHLSNKMVFPVPGPAIDILRSDGGRVVVPNVTTAMAGLYECKVSTGPPRFDVKVRAAAMEIFKPNRGRKPESNNNNEPAQPQVIENEFKTFTTCIQELLDQSVLLKGIKDANANDTVDEVCKKYCDKTPSFKNCFNQLVDSAKGYVGDKERAHLEVVFNVTEQLAQHVCSKSGDSIENQCRKLTLPQKSVVEHLKTCVQPSWT